MGATGTLAAQLRIAGQSYSSSQQRNRADRDRVRLLVVEAADDAEMTVDTICTLAGITPATYYKWADEAGVERRAGRPR